MKRNYRKVGRGKVKKKKKGKETEVKTKKEGERRERGREKIIRSRRKELFLRYYTPLSLMASHISRSKQSLSQTHFFSFTDFCEQFP